LVGIRDYTFQNIIFVHDFAFIYLILVFLMIISYFILILVEYTNFRQGIYYHLFRRDYTQNIQDWLIAFKRSKYYGFKSVFDRNLKIRKKRGWRRHEWIGIIVYSRFLKKILKQRHNLTLEIIWTFIPIIIIAELVFPSLSLIADDEISNKASLYAVNAIGNQWYWTYEVNVAMGVVKSVSNLLKTRGSRWRRRCTRLLATTNAVSIPVGLKTAFFITSNDVAHSWAIPGLGLKVDAIPGRINLKTVVASKIGLYSGMCSELCGIEHGFMPISLKVLTLNKWSYNMEYLCSEGNNIKYGNISNLWYF